MFCVHLGPYHTGQHGYNTWVIINTRKKFDFRFCRFDQSVFILIKCESHSWRCRPETTLIQYSLLGHTQASTTSQPEMERKTSMLQRSNSIQTRTLIYTAQSVLSHITYWVNFVTVRGWRRLIAKFARFCCVANPLWKQILNKRACLKYLNKV